MNRGYVLAEMKRAGTHMITVIRSNQINLLKCTIY